MKATELLKKLFAKAGITIEGELTDDIKDEYATQLDNSLLTVQAAINNHPDIKKVYFAQAFNGLDAEINSAITEFNVPDDAKAEILQINNSNKRAVALMKKIKELAEKATPVDKSKAAELQAEVTELHAKLRAEIDKTKTLAADYENKLQQKDIQTRLGTKLTKYKTVYDDLDPEAKDAAVNAIINKSLQDSGAEFRFDENGALVILKKDGTNLFGDNHTQVTPDAFLDKSLSKILKVTAPPGPVTKPILARQGQNPVLPAQNSPNSALSSMLAESMQDFEQSSRNGV